jgi:hypothetical protein
MQAMHQRLCGQRAGAALSSIGVVSDRDSAALQQQDSGGWQRQRRRQQRRQQLQAVMRDEPKGQLSNLSLLANNANLA